jgi:hypothetical protein
MSSSKLRSRPPGSVEEFISAAVTETRPTKPERRVRYSWQDLAVRADMIKVYNLRLPEPALLKLRYISEHTPHSMQQFCLNILLPAIDAKIDELTQKHGKAPAPPQTKEYNS